VSSYGRSVNPRAAAGLRAGDLRQDFSGRRQSQGNSPSSETQLSRCVFTLTFTRSPSGNRSRMSLKPGLARRLFAKRQQQ
jgi:hypothetical protein